MGRWLLPLMLAASAAYLTWLNHGGAVEGRVAVLPFVELLFPEVKGDPLAAGARSEQVAWGLTAVAFVFTALEQGVRVLRRWQDADEEDAG